MKSDKRYMTTGEYAEAKGLTTSQVTRMLREGELAGEKMGNRWQIPVDPASPPEKPGAAATGAPASEAYSVDEFAAMTYLTAWGVTDWLRSGRLPGHIDDAGSWRVDPACLQDPHVKRLLR